MHFLTHSTVFWILLSSCFGSFLLHLLTAFNFFSPADLQCFWGNLSFPSSQIPLASGFSLSPQLPFSILTPIYWLWSPWLWSCIQVVSIDIQLTSCLSVCVTEVRELPFEQKYLFCLPTSCLSAGKETGQSSQLWFFQNVLLPFKLTWAHLVFIPCVIPYDSAVSLLLQVAFFSSSASPSIVLSLLPFLNLWGIFLNLNS